MHRSTRTLWTVLMLLLSLALMCFTSAAQDEIAITISFPDFTANSLSTQRIIEEFEEQNPGVRVEIVSNGNVFFSPPSDANGISGFLANIENAVSDADVVSIDSNWLIPEATQAGHVLDIAPLVNGDTELNGDDFLSAAWDAFQWDGGMWALPTSYQTITLNYLSGAFDNAGFPHPDENWTLAELADAARALTLYDEDGNVVMAGLMIFDERALAMLIRSLLDGVVYDDSVIPSVPDFSDPALVEVLNELRVLIDEGVVMVRDVMGSIPATAMTIASSFFVFGNEGMANAQLPGGHAGLVVNGFAVSRGTAYPEVAYRLARFLVTHPEYAVTSGGYPALNSLLNPDFSPLVDVETALSPAELRFFNFVTPLVTDTSLDIESTLQSAQAEVSASLADFYAARDDVQIVIPTPRPEIALAPGEISISFAVSASLSPYPTEGQWASYAREFADADAEVGLVDFEVVQTGGTSDMTSLYDCFYTSNNLVPSVDLSLLTSLDPLLASDASFDADDLVGSVLQQVTRNDQVWAMPLTLEPEMMWYDVQRFTQANIPMPQGTWTISDFTAAYEALADLEDGVVITSYHFPPNDVYLLMLIAAYGGLPIDYRTDPPTLNFTDETNVAAIRQVLDIARAGRITYLSLTDMPMSSAGGTTGLVLSPLDDANSRNGDLVRMAGFGGDYRYVAYPTGTDYTPLAYNVGAAYISANAANPEACYRFISFIAQHPDLFTGMPVRRSQINSPEVEASRGAEAVAFYNVMDDAMNSLNAVEFPTDSATFGTGYERRWLDQAFDAYVLEDADLETALADAQVRTEAFLTCEAAIAADADYYQALFDCLTVSDTQ